MRCLISCASHAERGVEIHACAVINLTQKGAYVAALAQTPTTPDLKKEATAKTRLDFAIQQTEVTRAFLPVDIRYWAADGTFATQKYADAVVKAGLELVIKLRNDANMHFRFTGPRTGQAGRPKTYDGKVNWQDLSRFGAMEWIARDPESIPLFDPNKILATAVKISLISSKALRCLPFQEYLSRRAEWHAP
jgi:hypothetical protein